MQVYSGFVLGLYAEDVYVECVYVGKRKKKLEEFWALNTPGLTQLHVNADCKRWIPKAFILW